MLVARYRKKRPAPLQEHERTQARPKDSKVLDPEHTHGIGQMILLQPYKEVSYEAIR